MRRPRPSGRAPDDTAPGTTITAGPQLATNSTSATLEFSADEPGSTFQCRLDAGEWMPCTSPTVLSGLSEGGHTFSVRATDVAGNTEASVATRAWTVDTTAPDTSITTGPSGTTNSRSATFEFSSSERDRAFECRLDAGDWAGCLSPKVLGGLADGPHTFSVRSKDELGNTDGSPAIRTFRVDTRSSPPGGRPDAPSDSPPLATRIAAALERDLAGAVRALRRLGIARLVRLRGFTARELKALSAGRLSANLTGMASRGAGVARRVTLAKGSRSMSEAGRYSVRLRLTRLGRRLLRGDRRAKVTLTLFFRDASERTAVERKSVTLRR